MVSSSGKKVTDPRKLEEATQQVAELAKSDGVRIALLGGFAMQVYGSDRLTGDVDFVVDGPLPSMPPGRPLTFGGTKTVAPNGVEVDLILREDKYAPLYEAALAQAKRVRGSNIPMPIVTPEYLTAMKMVAARPRDDLDFKYLVAARVPDLEKAKKLVEKYLGPYAADDFDRLVEETDWLASKGRL